MTQLNRHQPDRPRIADGIDLRYRTLPDMNGRFIVTSPVNMIIAARLYRAVRRGEVPNFVAVSDLHDFLFPKREYGLSKKAMGAVVIRTVQINPRRLMGVSRKNDKVRVVYSFAHMLELQYGLEWMICTWLRKFLNDTLALRGECVVSGQEAMSSELDKLAECDDITFEKFYIENLWQFRMEEPDWATVAKGMKEPDWNLGREIIDRPPLKSYR